MKDKAAAEAASARGSADPPGTAGADPLVGTAGADPSGTTQTFTLETDQGNQVTVYDFRSQLSDLARRTWRRLASSSCPGCTPFSTPPSWVR